MRPVLAVMAALLLATAPLGGQPQGPPRYTLDFDPERDVRQSDRDEHGRPGLFVTVRFGITLEGDGRPADLSALYKVVVEEDGRRVHEDEVPRPAPVDDAAVVLALDTSGSMGEAADERTKESKMEALHRAAGHFVTTLPRAARATLLPFATEVGAARDYGGDREALIAAIRRLRPKGETALFDAVYAAVAALDEARTRGQRAVVAMTDGIDNKSRRRPEEVIGYARRAGVTLYLLGFGKPGELDEQALRRMADQTGGRYYHARDAGELRPSLERVSERIQTRRYEVTFRCRRDVNDGTARRVALKLVRRGGADAPAEEVLQAQQAGYHTPGVVIAQMDPRVYVALGVVLLLLLALPALLRRSRRDGD